ncbi:PIF1 family DEAD/DEAH box helicase [Acinetobacter sp. MD2(2019)]|uniref:PIF1 family DEAD/DEAH box helicase n=1 Tax=Acinetobacter sp. MD2(2019) TaxID=2605273 RepID=UPI002D1F3E19|nr:PIF1 family DEAD/DEAH box helicase [Acinetobacter sp. MD2(2019)]MEB3754866.1 AAA family ATPase [Acinetobacter sp. MD2(2019)]
MKQSTALEILKTGANVFLTGCAGTGKTYIINQYCDWLINNKEKEHKIARTASTGLAASQISGQTIHSWSGIGIKTEFTPEDLFSFSSKQPTLERLRAADVLIIDEISMLHRKQFELVDYVLKIARKNSLPFGGVQLIICGDFFQLPPISNNALKEATSEIFCFTGQSWRNANFQICYLTEQYRTTGGEFNALLNAIREDCIQPEHIQTLNQTANKPYDIEVLNLYTHNENVDTINFARLMQLTTPSFHFEAKSSGDARWIEALKKQMLTPEKLELKGGAKVLFTKNNHSNQFMNGTQGIVTSFSADEDNPADPTLYPVVKTVDGLHILAKPMSWELKDPKDRTLASVTQIPLVLAWAITVHKSQGMSLDEANIDLSRAFVEGQGYVALSRLRSIKGLRLSGFNTTALRVNELVQEIDKTFRETSDLVALKYEQAKQYSFNSEPPFESDTDLPF